MSFELCPFVPLGDKFPETIVSGCRAVSIIDGRIVEVSCVPGVGVLFALLVGFGGRDLFVLSDGVGWVCLDFRLNLESCQDLISFHGIDPVSLILEELERGCYGFGVLEGVLSPDPVCIREAIRVFCNSVLEG